MNDDRAENDRSQVKPVVRRQFLVTVEADRFVADRLAARACLEEAGSLRRARFGGESTREKRHPALAEDSVVESNSSAVRSGTS